MDSKTINLLGVILVFFGLFTLMFMHLNHEETRENALDKEHLYHILVGFPSSLLGALLLILAEKQTAVQNTKQRR
jgi:uncharacterized membrane protein